MRLALQLSLTLTFLFLASCESLPHGHHAHEEHASSQDKTFLQQASAAYAYQIAATELAVERATDPALKIRRQRNLKNHREAREHLEHVAKDAEASLSSSPNAQQQSRLSELRSATGSEFENAYLNQQTASLQEAIDLFQQQLVSGEHTVVRAFAQSHLPTLREQLKTTKEAVAATTQPSK